MKTETDTVRVLVIQETAGAYLLRDLDEPAREAFFPKSTVSFDRRNIKTGEATAVISLWILEQKGWNN